MPSNDKSCACCADTFMVVHNCMSCGYNNSMTNKNPT